MLALKHMYHVKTEQYSGPMEKLLELIESKKLDVTGFSLAAVTADFLAYVEALKDQAVKGTGVAVSPRVLAEFLTIAAQLVLIKSKELLPDLTFSPEEQEQVADLERRLLVYGSLKPLFGLMRISWMNTAHAYGRELMQERTPIFYPPATLQLKDLEKALGSLLQSLGSLVLESEHIEKQLISLEEKIIELSAQIIQGVSRFSSLASQKPKEELIVLFLALLHLLRDQTVQATQDGLFGEIEMETCKIKT
jgi:segregation and condensation protein A